MPRLLLYTIAFLEGFVTLAVELLAIRLSVPIVGHTLILTGVMLGTILLALSGGYWAGGRVAARLAPADIPRYLQRNFLIAALTYLLVVFPLHRPLMQWLIEVTASLELTVLVTSLLYVFPVWIASQSIPLLTELDRSAHAGERAGRMLFFSTVGSTLGATLTPALLFSTVGVTRSALVLITILLVCAVAVRRVPRTSRAAPALVLGALLLAGGWALPARAPGQVDTAYQTMIVRDAGERRQLVAGLAVYSEVDARTLEPTLAYAREMQRLAVDDRRVLVVGAAGMALPQVFAQRGAAVTAVDVDPAMLRVTQEAFLREPLHPNVKFVHVGARAHVTRTDERYDHVILDAFSSVTIPAELVTREFFREVSALAPRVSMNFIADPALETTYARRMLSTFREAFPRASYRQVNDGPLVNFLLSSVPLPGYTPVPQFGARVYTDDLNTVERDVLGLGWQQLYAGRH